MTEQDKEQQLKSLFIKTVSENKIPMFRLAYSIVQNQQDAEDVVSETVLKAYSHLADLRNPKKLKAWLFQILVNESKACQNRKKQIELVADTSSFRENLVNEEAHDTLLEFAYRLDEVFREVIILYYFEEFNVKEIAKILQISEGTVKSRLSRARAKLKQFLENDDSWKG